MWNLTKAQAYAVLGLSIVCELIGSGFLEACNGFQRLDYAAVMVVGYSIAFYLFSKVLHIINLAVGYATWSAVGTIVTSLMSQFIFNDPISLVGWIALVGLTIGVVGINLYGTPPEPDPGSEKAISPQAPASRQRTHSADLHTFETDMNLADANFMVQRTHSADSISLGRGAHSADSTSLGRGAHSADTISMVQRTHSADSTSLGRGAHSGEVSD